jgi:geranylgeranyl pyrophosphate synthase
MQLAPREDAATIRYAIEKGDVDALQAVASIVKRTGALDAAMRSAQSEISRALEAAQHLPAGPYVDCMVQLAQQSLARNN